MAVFNCSFQFKKFEHFRLWLCFTFLLLICSSFRIFSQKKYHKEFYNNGQIKEEGWVLNDKKTAFWKFFYKNGILKKEGHFTANLETNYWYFYGKDASKEKEGHFKKGSKNNWWLFYDENGFVNHKCQLKNNQKNGYCLIYNKKKLIKASKYKNGKKIKQWTDFSSFKNENSLYDLR